MIGIQIIAIIFAIWMIYFSYLHFRRGEFKKIEFILWQVLWIGLIIVVIYPSSVKFILETFNINRTFDLVVIVGVVVLFGITFRNYVLLKRTEKKLVDLIRQEGLKDIK
ncbi:MAG: DUF2304 domain-containing protein [bacterium]|nr:DUF2304 domain-containing protein [bacterium]